MWIGVGTYSRLGANLSMKNGACAGAPYQTICILKLIFKYLRADVSKYRPEVYKSEKSKILKKIHKVALGKLLT